MRPWQDTLDPRSTSASARPARRKSRWPRRSAAPSARKRGSRRARRRRGRIPTSPASSRARSPFPGAKTSRPATLAPLLGRPRLAVLRPPTRPSSRTDRCGPRPPVVDPRAPALGASRRSPARRSGRAAGCRSRHAGDLLRTWRCRRRRSGCRSAGWLKALNASARSSAVTRLAEAEPLHERRSTFQKPGPLIESLRVMLPRCSARAPRRPPCRSRAARARCPRTPRGRRR